MSDRISTQIRHDLELIERFAATYGARFATLIEELNAGPTQRSVDASVRLCVEAVHMLLSIQNTLAGALREVSGQELRRAA